MRAFGRLLIIFSLFLASCQQEADELQRIVAKGWVSAQGDTLRINNTNGQYSLLGTKSSHKGRWSLDENYLLLFPERNFSAAADSVVYSEFADENSVALYREDSLVAIVSGNKITSAAEPITWKIDTADKQLLQLSTDAEVLRFTRIQPAAVGGMSVKGVLRGLLGLLTLLTIAWLFSKNRKAISWSLVSKGILFQIVLALAILKVPFFASIFDYLSKFFVEILSFTREGSQFVFGGLVSDVNSFGFIFAFQVLPTIIFFSAVTSLLFYLGILQKVVYAFAWIMKRLMKLSGAESLAAAGNIFLGQTEAPLLVKPYIGKMTRSELLCLMSGGMATIAGGVLAAYIGFLGGQDPEQELFFARHLLAASVMSAPAAIVAAKMLLPETEPVDETLSVSTEKIGSNVLESITNGATEGLKLAVNVAAMLIVFIALIAMADFFFEDMIGRWTGLNQWVVATTNGQFAGFNLQFILGYTLKPIAWLMGANWNDSALLGQLLGEKTILNEFVAYVSLGNLKEAGAFTEQKSVIIATYMLCGFSNFASIGIQIGGIGVLAPEKRAMLGSLGMRALLGGTLACLFTAVVAGMFY